ncbi:MAG: hypothetical protein U0457_01510 [Candidatus Sericytochromatia bacterium]
MSSVHLHLLINHLPVLGLLFATGILIYSFIRKNEDILKLGLFTIIISALFNVPTYFSGENSEERVEHLPGVSERLIEEHEDYAKIALILTGILGVLSLLGVFKNNNKLVLSVIFILLLITDGVIAKTANLGGQIRHTEIRDNKSNSYGEGKDSSKSSGDTKEKGSSKSQSSGKSSSNSDKK